ncbi:uncharacterized protein NECHADRAFT_88817 [Fusarium vanettenii 77-13-4]|uniref:Clr5 domain-containing protein n=1 Tax=Fusarium vanettenii (strain ATCC MYA-4622 / CBS 123669 / FGSC 9596 / NRRL 45880 / 77-13-4) TaxID=660122 RepID=C7ZQ12_FUSV7|nr:uncharacterized protein NECHADRAFT_88817 [Fusarium vanettenii 77-13-4]EEU33898.1 hypothetical protein NECHADRAFT_88817 [Fusarium vanettenii 77-13-4]
MAPEQRPPKHTEEEWEGIKEVFTTLWIDDDLSLREVIDAIATSHSFQARTFTANASSSAVHDGNRLRAERNQYPEILSGLMPSLKPTLFRPLQSPGHLRSMHLAAFAIHDSFQRAQMLMLAPPMNDANRTGLTVPHRHEDGWPLGEFYVRAQTLSSFMSVPNFASRALNIETLNGGIQDYVSQVVDDMTPSPINIICILQLCCRFCHDDQIPVLRILFRFIRQRAALRTHGHHLQLLCDSLLDSLDILLPIILFAARQAVQNSSTVLGPRHPQTLSALRGLHSALLCWGDFSSALQVSIHCENQETEVERDSLDATTAWRVEAAVRRIRCELSMNRLHDAEVHLSELARSVRAIEVESGSIDWHILFAFLDFRGELLRLQGNPAAEDLLEEAYSVAQANCQLFNWWYFIYAERHMEFAKKPMNRWTPFHLFV